MIKNEYSLPISYRLERNIQVGIQIKKESQQTIKNASIHQCSDQISWENINSEGVITHKNQLDKTCRYFKNFKVATDKSQYIVLPGKYSSLGLSGDYQYLSLWIGKIDDCKEMLIYRHKSQKNQQLQIIVDKEGMYNNHQNMLITFYIQPISIGSSIKYTMNKKQTIASVKLQCQLKQGYSPDKFCLLKRRGKILNVTHTIEQCSIKEGEKIEAMPIFNPSMNG